MASQAVTSLTQVGAAKPGEILTQLQRSEWARDGWEACLGGGFGKPSLSGDFQVGPSEGSSHPDAMSMNSDYRLLQRNLTRELQSALDKFSAALNRDVNTMPTTSFGRQVHEKPVWPHAWSALHSERSLHTLEWLRATLKQQMAQHAQAMNARTIESYLEDASEVMGSLMSSEAFSGWVPLGSSMEDSSPCYKHPRSKHPNFALTSPGTHSWVTGMQASPSRNNSDAINQDPIYVPLPSLMTAPPCLPPGFEGASQAKQEVSTGINTLRAQAATKKRTSEVRAKTAQTVDPAFSCEEMDPSRQTLRMHLRSLENVDGNQVLLVRRISRLGFDSPHLLKSYFSWYGEVSEVRVAHSKVKTYNGRAKFLRWRPSSLGFVVMESSDDAAAILKQGSEQVVAGVVIQVQPFQQRAISDGGEEDADSQNSQEKEQ